MFSVSVPGVFAYANYPPLAAHISSFIVPTDRFFEPSVSRICFRGIPQYDGWFSRGSYIFPLESNVEVSRLGYTHFVDERPSGFPIITPFGRRFNTRRHKSATRKEL